MGVCINKSDTRSAIFVPQTQGTLKFNCELRDIRLHHHIKSCQLHIDVGGMYNFTTPSHISADGHHQWKITKEFQIEATEQQLHDKYLKITLNEEFTIIPILDICTGPQNFDFPLGRGRISFFMDMSQIILIEIKCISLECTMNECVQEKGYQYDFKLISNNMIFQSDFSETFFNPSLLKHNHPMQSCSFSDLYVLSWDDEQTQPTLQFELPINLIPNISLQISIWGSGKFLNEDHQPQRFSMKSLRNLEEIEIQLADRILIAESYIAFYQLFQGHEFLKIGMIQHRTEIKKTLWKKGLKQGSIKSMFIINNPIYLKQQLLGQRTEHGVQMGNSILTNQNTKEIAEIVTIFQGLDTLMFKFQLPISVETRNELFIQVQNLTDQLHQKISQSDKDNSSRQFYYKNYEDLMNGQQTFIKIADHITNYVDKLDRSLREKYYQILDVVCTRGELRLNQLGYFDECQKLSKKQLKLKNQICQEYATFLYKTLDLALKKVTQRGLLDNERQFVYRFLVQAFFRIPQFRDQFVACLIKQNDPPLNEWRGTDFTLEEPIQIEGEEIVNLFDWQNYFYNYLTLIPQIQTDLEWQVEMNKREYNFCVFVKEYCEYVVNIFPQKIIPWRTIPGYRQILKAILTEVKIQEFYTDALLSAIRQLTCNPNIVNVIIMIVFHKTDINQQQVVVQTMEILNNCLKQLQLMPNNLDYAFFLNGINLVLTNSLHAFSLSKTLQLIYENFPIFPLEFKKQLSEKLFDDASQNLFLHWSKSVRNVFQTLIVYRYYHNYKNQKVLNMDEEKFQLTFQKSFQQIQKPRRMQSYFENRDNETQLLSDYMFVKYQKFMGKIEQKLEAKPKRSELPLIERMKQKLQNKNVPIQEDLFQTYLHLALSEFYEIMKGYKKWRMSLTKEQILKQDFMVPQIKILEYYDGREGK